ncbi:MAG: hypothetical protein QF440_00265 [Candidatus Thalassarchaeaceae archaeon]|nr:hypothetical protein [Candidatus Thalassarchaeaceae archaeon]
MRFTVSVFLVALLLIFTSSVNQPFELAEIDEQHRSDSNCENGQGNSSIDRNGCLDSDGDGFSDPDANWTLEQGADACPFTVGKSREILNGCTDMDRDWIADMIDPDIDGDGITNEFELISSSLTERFDPYDKESHPPDFDFDLVPDLIDEDDDNDGWPDRVEIDRGSDEFDPQETPFNMYFGTTTGFYYLGGFSTSDEFTTEGTEISLSVFIEIATGEMVIPILLIPLYLALFGKRRRHYNRLSEEIDGVKDFSELARLEVEVNQFIKDKKIRVYHGLILRNSIEQRETELGSLVEKNPNNLSEEE